MFSAHKDFRWTFKWNFNFVGIFGVPGKTKKFYRRAFFANKKKTSLNLLFGERREPDFRSVDHTHAKHKFWGGKYVMSTSFFLTGLTKPFSQHTFGIRNQKTGEKLTAHFRLEEKEIVLGFIPSSKRTAEKNKKLSLFHSFEHLGLNLYRLCRFNKILFVPNQPSVRIHQKFPSLKTETKKKQKKSQKKMTSTIIMIKMTALMRPAQKPQQHQLSEPKVLFFSLSQLLKI